MTWFQDHFAYRANDKRLFLFKPTVVKMCNIPVSSRPQDGGICLWGVYLQVFVSCYHSLGVCSVISVQVVSYLDLVCNALVFQPGPSFCVGASGLVFGGYAWGEAVPFLRICLLTTYLSSGLWLHVCLFFSLLTMYLSPFLFLCIFLSHTQFLLSLLPSLL